MMTLLNSVIFKQNKKTPIWSNISYKIEKFSVSYSEFSIRRGIIKKKNTNNEKSNPIEFELKPGMKQKLRYTSVANHKGLIL